MNSLVRLYPQTWRDRYETELLILAWRGVPSGAPTRSQPG